MKSQIYMCLMHESTQKVNRFTGHWMNNILVCLSKCFIQSVNNTRVSLNVMDRAFGEIKRILRYSGLSDVHVVRIGRMNIPRGLIRGIFLLAFAFTISAESILGLANPKIDLDTFIFLLYVVLSFVCVLSIYLCLMLKTAKIWQLFEFVDGVIDKRRYI